MTAFASFPPRLQEAIVAQLGWTSLRPVQELAGEALLAGKNAVVLAPTAGGKTEAAIFPCLAELTGRPAESVGVIYVAPIKALLNNQEERLKKYAEMVGLRAFVWHGDVTDADKRGFVKEPAEVLMTTPESLEVMLLSQRFPLERAFRDLRAVVVDEVHAFAGTDRGAHLLSVVERIALCTKNDVQRIGLSATVGNPEQILTWLKGTSQRAGVVVSPPKVPAPRQLAIELRQSVVDVARGAAEAAAGQKSLFFCQSRSLTESVGEHMRGKGTDVFVHHSSVSREERRAAEERFHHGADACIVCTSTLELGIDVGDLDKVLQTDAPSTVSSFLQRMGRTGRRAGHVANTTFFCQHTEAVLQAVALVELAREGWIEDVPVQTRCWPVLVHQLLALTLQFGAVSSERCWDQLSRVPDFAGITREEFVTVVGHMLDNGYLFEAGGLLSMGNRAERVFGRRNFMELYAVFSSPVLYRVETSAGRELGSLEQDFVDRLVDNMSSFLLAGRAWCVEHVNHVERTVKVREAPRGQKPSWGGYLPQMLGQRLCEKMRDVLVSSATYPYADVAAMKAIQERREDLGALLGRGQPALQLEDDLAHWWTFAGGRINHTLKHALEWKQGWQVGADNTQLRITGAGVTLGAVEKAIAELAAPAFWEEPGTRQALLTRLPEYRLSKFQDALPPAMALEMIGGYFLDVEGTARFLQLVHP